MVPITLESILDFLRKNNYEGEIQTDTQQVYTILKIAKKEHPLFFRIFDEGNLLQLLVFIPCHLQPSKPLSEAKPAQGESTVQENRVIGDMARLLHLLNKELDVPGFGMDEMAGVVFYRLMLPTPNKKIDRDLLVAFLKTIDHVCTMFTSPIEAVSTGHVTLDSILTKARTNEG